LTPVTIKRIVFAIGPHLVI